MGVYDIEAPFRGGGVVWEKLEWKSRDGCDLNSTVHMYETTKKTIAEYPL